MFEGQRLDILRFSYVNDEDNLVEHAAITAETITAVKSLNCGCGIFELRKSSQEFEEQRSAA